MATFPVIAEIWNLFEATLQGQAKKLVDDLAKANGRDPKELWAKVKPQLRVGLLDVELPEELPCTCPFPSSTPDGAIRLRCRAPCLLGFPACPTHINKPTPTSLTQLPVVDRILDFENKTYYVCEKGIARDKNGKPKGIVKEGSLYLWEKEETRLAQGGGT